MKTVLIALAVAAGLSVPIAIAADKKGQNNQKNDGQKNQKDDGQQNQNDDGGGQKKLKDVELRAEKNANALGAVIGVAVRVAIDNRRGGVLQNEPVKGKKGGNGESNQNDDGEKNQKDDGQRNQKGKSQ